MVKEYSSKPKKEKIVEDGNNIWNKDDEIAESFNNFYANIMEKLASKI